MRARTLRHRQPVMTGWAVRDRPADDHTGARLDDPTVVSPAFRVAMPGLGERRDGVGRPDRVLEGVRRSAAGHARRAT